MFCLESFNHHWGKWEDDKRIEVLNEDSDEVICIEIRQIRYCIVCGKVQIRLATEKER
jgi:hypothetical protein